MLALRHGVKEEVSGEYQEKNCDLLPQVKATRRYKIEKQNQLISQVSQRFRRKMRGKLPDFLPLTTKNSFQAERVSSAERTRHGASPV